MTGIPSTRDETTRPLRIRAWYLSILALSGFVTSFGAHIVATNLPAYAEIVGVGAFMIGLLIGVYDFAELFAKPIAGFIADRRGMKLTLLAGLGIFILGTLLFLVISPTLLLLVALSRGSVLQRSQPSQLPWLPSTLSQAAARRLGSITQSKARGMSSRRPSAGIWPIPTASR